jgi:hypothetical protein
MLDDALTFTIYARAAQRFIGCFPGAGSVPSAALNLIMDYCAPDWRPNNPDEVRQEVARAADAALLDSSRGTVVFVNDEDAAVLTDHMHQLLEYAEALYFNWAIDDDFCRVESTH